MIELLCVALLLLTLVLGSTIYRAKLSVRRADGVQRISCHGALQLGERTAAFCIECDGKRFMLVRSPQHCTIVPTAAEPL